MPDVDVFDRRRVRTRDSSSESSAAQPERCCSTSYDGRYLGEPAFESLFEELDRRGALVFVHPTAAAPCCFGLTPEIGTAPIQLPVRYGAAPRRVSSMGRQHRHEYAENPRSSYSHGRRDPPNAHRIV